MNYFKLLLIIVGIFFAFGSFSYVSAADKNLKITFDPLNPNFSLGQKSMIYLVLQTDSDMISAASISLIAKNNVQILDILSPVDMQNTPITNTKIVNKKIADKQASATVLMVKNTRDLPTSIKIPFIVEQGSGQSGIVQVEKKTTEIIDALGKKFTLTLPKDVTITFSADGKTNNPAPSPTPLPASNMVLNLTTTLQGITSDEVKQKTLSGFKVQLIQKNGNIQKVSLPQLISMTVDAAGKWRGSMVVSDMQPGGSYQLLIKGPKQLQKRICENRPQENEIGKYECSGYALKLVSGQNELDFSGISLMSGDLGIQDGILNSFDLSLVQNAIRKSTKLFQNDADVNIDGKVDKKDYDIVIQTLSKTKGLDQK